MSEKPRCKRCGRILKDPVSIACGMGPECRNAKAGSGKHYHAPRTRGRSPSAYSAAGSSATGSPAPVASCSFRKVEPLPETVYVGYVFHNDFPVLVAAETISDPINLRAANRLERPFIVAGEFTSRITLPLAEFHPLYEPVLLVERASYSLPQTLSNTDPNKEIVTQWVPLRRSIRK